LGSSGLAACRPLLLFRFSAANDALIKDWRACRNLGEKLHIAHPRIARLSSIALSGFGVALVGFRTACT
jgi:hypothetical protein